MSISYLFNKYFHIPQQIKFGYFICLSNSSYMFFTDNYKNCFKCSNYSGNSYVKYLPQTDNNSFDNIYKKNSIEQFLKKNPQIDVKKV